MHTSQDEESAILDAVGIDWEEYTQKLLEVPQHLQCAKAPKGYSGELIQTVIFPPEYARDPSRQLQ